MSIVVQNTLATWLDVPGVGLVFPPLGSLTVDGITPELAAAIQAGKVTVTSQSDSNKIIAASNGQTVFALPFPWPGPDHAHLVVAGLVRTYGVDFTVDAETNELTWINGGVTILENDILTFLKTGSYPENLLGNQVVGGGIADGALTFAKLNAALLAKFVVVSFETPDVEAGNEIAVQMRLKDLAGDYLAAEHVVRVTCDDRATMTVGVSGSALAGDGTSDLIAKTSALGKLDLTVAFVGAATISLAVGATQLSPMLDCAVGADLVFA